MRRLRSVAAARRADVNAQAGVQQLQVQVNRLAAQLARNATLIEDTRKLLAELRASQTMILIAMGARVPVPDQVVPLWTGLGLLTAREREVAKLVAEGMTNAQIGAALGIACRTAASHVDHLSRKLGFTRRSQIIAWVHSGP